MKCLNVTKLLNFEKKKSQNHTNIYILENGRVIYRYSLAIINRPILNELENAKMVAGCFKKFFTVLSKIDEVTDKIISFK